MAIVNIGKSHQYVPVPICQHRHARRMHADSPDHVNLCVVCIGSGIKMQSRSNGGEWDNNERSKVCYAGKKYCQNNRNGSFLVNIGSLFYNHIFACYNMWSISYVLYNLYNDWTYVYIVKHKNSVCVFDRLSVNVCRWGQQIKTPSLPHPPTTRRLSGRPNNNRIHQTIRGPCNRTKHKNNLCRFDT